MPPKALVSERDFFQYPLREHINLKHPLVSLSELIDWEGLNVSMIERFVSCRGRPATSPRLIAGLLYLQHTFDLSDDEVVSQWMENPYWQVFTGETYFQTEAPIAPSSLTCWRKRLGKEGVERMLLETIEAAKRAKVVKDSSVKRVIVDTTVMEKAIAYPTDSRLLERCREHLVKAADRHSLKLRQNYNREAPKLVGLIGRYAHEWEHEMFYHSGQGDVFGEGRWNPVATGSVVFVKGGEEHQIRNTGSEPLVVICLIPSGVPEL